MQTKITLLLIFLGVIPAGILGWFASKYQEDVLEANKQMYEGFANHIKSEVSRRVRYHRSLLASVGAILPRDPLSPRDAGRSLTRVLELDRIHDQAIDGLAFFDRGKRMLASAGIPPRVKDLTKLFSDVVFDNYGGSASLSSSSTEPIQLRGTWGGLGGPIFTQPDQVIEGPTAGSQTQLKFLVYGEEGQIRGALIASLTADYFSRSLNKVLSELSEISQKVDIYVLDSSNQRIAATRNARYREEPVITPVLLATSDREMANRMEVKLKTFYTPDWHIVLVPKAAAFEPIKKTRTKSLQVVQMVILAAILLGLIFTLNITNPLNRLVQSALTISQGDLSRPVDVHSKDEIGDLAQTFELMRINLARMQQSLNDKINELGTLYDVGKAISSTLNLSELLNLILDLVMKLTKADRGSIMLLDEEKMELKIAVAKGLPPEVIERTRVKLGEKVSGYVLETARPLLIVDPSKSPSFQRIKEHQVHQGSLISVPLIAKEKKLGVLNISKGVTYSLSERELEFFKALSHQAAIAIENARLYEMAIKDELTKLFVRRYFDQRLREEIRRAKRYRSSVTVMILDIDHFKSFNDTYGHASGDGVLCFLAGVMRDSMRNVDIVSRYGGEEFAILCPEQNLKEAKTPAERIRSGVESTELKLCGVSVRCTVSIGMASFPHDAQKPEDLMELADQALYFAKNNGRNQVAAYREVSGQIPPTGSKG